MSLFITGPRPTPAGVASEADEPGERAPSTEEFRFVVSPQFREFLDRDFATREAMDARRSSCVRLYRNRRSSSDAIEYYANRLGSKVKATPHGLVVMDWEGKRPRDLKGIKKVRRTKALGPDRGHGVAFGSLPPPLKPHSGGLE